MKIRLEYGLLMSFLVGLLAAYLIPVKISLFLMIVDGFVSIFMLLAPFVVFLILFNSACSLMVNRKVAGRVIESSMVFFASLVVGCSVFASVFLSFLLPSSTSPVWFSEETFSHVSQIVLTSLVRPVTVALFLGVAFALGFSYTPLFQRVIDLSKRMHGAQEQAFNLLLKIFPIITMSLGASLYYNLGKVSIEAYVVSMMLTMLFGAAALAILFIFVAKLTHRETAGLARYSTGMFAIGLSVGSSYVILPLALKAFREHFDADNSVGDLVLTLGASVNRCGSVMGVLIVTFVAAHYTGAAVSWQQMLLLAVPVALIGFGSPGIQGGTLLVAMPVILHVISPTDGMKFVAVALAMFVGGTTFIQAAVNTVASGYIALLVDNSTRAQSRSVCLAKTEMTTFSEQFYSSSGNSSSEDG